MGQVFRSVCVYVYVCEHPMLEMLSTAQNLIFGPFFSGSIYGYRARDCTLWENASRVLEFSWIIFGIRLGRCVIDCTNSGLWINLPETLFREGSNGLISA